MIRYINDHQDRPFFLFSSFIEPHHQNHRNDYPAPPGYAERYRGRWLPPDLAALGGSSHQHLAGYLGMIKRLDEALGRLVDALISLDLLEDTIILFTSDHGNHFKTRNAEYKRSCHDASVRVPTMLYGGPFTGGGRISQLVSLIDLPPTLARRRRHPRARCNERALDLAAGPRRSHRLAGGSFHPDERVAVRAGDPQQALEIRRYRARQAWLGRFRQRYSYVESELYDSARRSGGASQPRRALETHRAVSDVLRARLIRRMIEANEDEPVIEPAPLVPGGEQLRVDIEEGWL